MCRCWPAKWQCPLHFSNVSSGCRGVGYRGCSHDDQRGRVHHRGGRGGGGHVCVPQVSSGPGVLSSDYSSVGWLAGLAAAAAKRSACEPRLCELWWYTYPAPKHPSKLASGN